MLWGKDLQLTELAQRLVDTRLRVERLRLVKRLQLLESRVSAQGIVIAGFSDLRKELQRATPESPDRVDPSLVLLRKPVGVWRRRYLEVQTKPGSVF